MDREIEVLKKRIEMATVKRHTLILELHELKLLELKKKRAREAEEILKFRKQIIGNL